LKLRNRHSQKPEEVINRIELMYPDFKKIELFCRYPRENWRCIGNEITGNDIRMDLKLVSLAKE